MNDMIPGAAMMNDMKPRAPLADADRTRRVVIIGDRVVAHLAAAHLKKQYPELEVICIGRPGKAPPVVGESTIEASTAFMRACGFEQLLSENHFHKFGLTFYYKLDAEGGPEYAIHEEPAIPPLPACLVNRFTFDRDARALNEQRNIRYVSGTVFDVRLERGRHTVRYRDASGEERSIEARWIIDASGRSRVLGKKLGLTERARHQRSTFWFRLEGFDRTILTDLNHAMRKFDPSMRDQIAYDPYYVTHHFMGRGNWIWCIPVASESEKDVISIGITYRPDLYTHSIRTYDEFLTAVEEEHPVLGRFLRSGTVCEGDINMYNNYMYASRQHYSDDGWFIVGDAANAVDPLYSNGLMLASVQLMQVAAYIGGELGGRPDPEYLREADEMYKSLYERAQGNISDHYTVMHDPYQSSHRVHWVTTIYFYFVLPWFLCGYHTDKQGVKLMKNLIQNTIGLQESAYRLFAEAARTKPARSPADVFNWYHESINYRLLTARERDLSYHLSRMLFLNARMRYSAMLRAGPSAFPRQLTQLGREILLGTAVRAGFSGRPLRASPAFERLAALRA